jgi:uncharacterized protein (TIGR02246 family)
MKIRLLLALVGLAISFALPIFAQQKDTVDPQIAQQIRVLAMKYDEAINMHDAAAVAALYTQDAVWTTYHDGTFHSRQAIEKAYAKYDFKRWQYSNYVTTVGRVIAVGNEVRSTGKWSCAFQSGEGGPGNDEGHYSWVIVREGDTWKIHRDTMGGTAANPAGVVH